MQARVARKGEVMIIHLSGRLDVETAEPFRSACLSHLEGKKVVFDFKALSFVGSSGIIPFLEAMQTYATTNAGFFKFSGVGTEFKRVFAATPLSSVEIFETDIQAVDALMRPTVVEVPLVVQAAPLADRCGEESSGADLNRSSADFGYLNLKHEAESEEVPSSESVDRTESTN